MRHYAGTFLALFMLHIGIAVQAADDEQIVFTAEPTYSKAETIKLYTPLMDYLSEVTGKKFVLEPAANFVEYSVRMRLKKYDMMFDEPHLTGWRMVNLSYSPLVRLPGTINIVVVAGKDADISTMEDLDNGRSRVCAFEAPELVTMAFLSYFPNPVRQPYLVRTHDMKDLLSCLKSHHGVAAVMSDAQWEKLGEEERAEMKLIARPERGYPERTVSAGPKVDEATRKQVADALLSEKGKAVCQPLLERFGKSGFIPANAQEYAGLDQLLNSMWGFHTH